LNRLTSSTIAAAIRVHRALGPGLLEGAYLACLAYELNAAGLTFELQRAVPIRYRGVRLECAFRADLMIENALIVEVKAMDSVLPVHRRQLHTYLRAANCAVGLLLNFGAPTMKEGIVRVVNQFPDSSPPGDAAAETPEDAETRASTPGASRLGSSDVP
jgi:GxxExxY protein